MTSDPDPDPEAHRGRLLRARAVSWITLGVFVVVGVVSVVLAVRDGATPLLLLADAACLFIAVRTVLRLRALSTALRELDGSADLRE
jgi:hypothetical protein